MTEIQGETAAPTLAGRAVSERAAVGVIAAVAALPTLYWGLTDAAFISDDHWISYWFDELGIWRSLDRIAFNSPGRPLAGPYYLFVYEVIGSGPLVQSLLLAALNAALVVSLWRLGRRAIPTSLLLCALAAFAVLPNRGATRLWFVVGTYPLAMAMAVTSVVLLVRGRALLAGGLLAAAILLYEGVAGLGLALVLLVVLADRARWRAGAIVAGAGAAAAGAAYINSPRRPGASGVGPFGSADTLGAGLMGEGLTGEEMVGPVLAVALLAVLGWSVLTLFEPLKRRGIALHHVRLGGLLLFAGAGPALVGGAPFAVAGLNERNNLVPSVGLALAIGALLWALIDRLGCIGVVLASALLLLLFVRTMDDTVEYAAALDDGARLTATLDRTFAEGPPSEPVLLVPALDRIPGVAAFVQNIDVRGAMHLRVGGDWSSLHLVETVTCGRLRDDGTWTVLDVFTGDRSTLSGGPLFEACVAAGGR